MINAARERRDYSHERAIFEGSSYALENLIIYPEQMYPERTFSVKDEAVHPMGLAFNNSCDKLENAQKIMDLFIKENAYDPQKEVVIEGKPQSFTYELCRMIKHHFYKWKNSYKPDLTLL